MEELALTVLAEWPARFALVAHALLGAATIAVSTHLVVWTYPLLFGRPARTRAIGWFAATGALLYAAQFALGILLYPTYKVRVAAELAETSWAPRLFEVKEHWVALGLPLLLAAWVLARRGRDASRLLFACAFGAAICAWSGGIIGLMVTSARSIASP